MALASPRRILPLLASLLLLALTAHWLLARGREQPAVGLVTPALQASEARETPLLEGGPSSERERVGESRPTHARAQEVVPDDAPGIEEPPDGSVWLNQCDLPPDPIESGPASLLLNLIDASSGAPVASRVELWRVDAPGNAAWTDGDQLQLAADVPAGGVRFWSLPEGRYRVVCDVARVDAPPPELELHAPLSERQVTLELPREFELRIRFLDHFGDPYASAEWWEAGGRAIAPAPHVARSRSPRDLVGYSVSEGLGWSNAPGVHTLGGPQPPEGFSLGRQRECSRAQSVVRVLRLRAPDGALVEVEVPARSEGDVELVAVGLPPDLAASCVRLPDGSASTAHVEALGLARTLDDLAGDWIEAPIRITAEWTGFEAHASTWRPADGELPWILLQPLE